MLSHRYQNPWKTLGAVSVGGLGLVIIALTLFDVTTDIFVQREAVAMTATENVPPLVLSLGLVWVSQWLLTSITDRRYIYTVVRWTGIVFVGTIVTAGWIALFRHVQGRIEPVFLLADVLAIVTLAGAIIGIYDAERTENQEKLRKERDRRDALIGGLADAAAEIEITDDGTARVLNKNQKYDELFDDRIDPLPDELIDKAVPGPEGNEDRAIPADGGIIERQVTRQTKRGEQVFELRSVPVDKPNGGHRRYVVYSDLSDSLEAEERIATLESEVEALAELQTIANDAGRSMPERTGALLETTCEAVDAEVGVLCKPYVDESATGRSFEVVATSEAAPVTVGDEFTEQTELLRRLESGPVRTLPDDSPADLLVRTEPRDQAGVPPGPFEGHQTFIGGEVYVDGEFYGVSCFATTEHDAFGRGDETVVYQANRVLGLVVGRWMTDQELHEQSERLEFVANTISHDFRNPLQVVSANAQQTRYEIEQLGVEPEEQLWECLDRIASGVNRLDELADEVVRLAREGRGVENIQPVDPGELAEDVWVSTETAEATLTVTDDVETVRGDRPRLKRVFENIFRNAVEHGGSDVTVSVGELDEGGFYIADDGAGFPPGLDPDEVFERHRTGTEGGSGVGLWLVDVIASAHGWDVRAVDREDGGTRFEIRTDVANY